MAEKKKVPARDDPKWWEERNRRRRERYAKDKEYREQQKAAVRNSYREENPVKSSATGCNLKRIDEFGETRKVHAKGIETMHVLTNGEMADVIDRDVKIFYRWIKDGRFPESVIEGDEMVPNKGRSGVRPMRVGVYTLAEAKAAAEVLATHFGTLAVVRKDHVDTLTKLWVAVRAARREQGIPLGTVPEEIKSSVQRTEQRG